MFTSNLSFLAYLLNIYTKTDTNLCIHFFCFTDLLKRLNTVNFFFTRIGNRCPSFCFGIHILYTDFKCVKTQLLLKYGLLICAKEEKIDNRKQTKTDTKVNTFLHYVSADGYVFIAVVSMKTYPPADQRKHGVNVT